MKLDTKFLDQKKIQYTVTEEGAIKVGGYLDLRGTGITALPENLTVGGYLDLQGTGITALPENLTVGGYLDLQGTGITALPENLTVGGYLYLQGTGITEKKYSMDVSLSLSVKKITNADGIWGRVLSKKGNLSKIKIFGRKEVSFLASSDDGEVHAHGKTAAEAVAELAFKMADKGDLSDLADMPMDTVKTAHEWGFVYRRATGACKLGTENFMSARVKKDTYTLAEIIEETKGAFGHDQFKSVVGAA
jgi:hypothetical protein